MIIILEGSRKTGKSTFANAIKKYTTENGKQAIILYDRKLQSLDVDQKTANYISCMQMIAAADSIEFSLGSNTIVIFDRLHISELVYGKNLRGYENLAMYKIDNMLANSNAKLFLFESKTNSQRMNLGEETYEKDFRRHFKESCLLDKVSINLDSTRGVITNEMVEQIFKEVGIKL